ncbi:hypothetical protein AKO1_015771 [Acrasis kona]|uniref:histidine kinase n=1 Tax=Acrasis kona TaxID=1008807 RepID=A0AAW2ZHS5_9EUKA
MPVTHQNELRAILYVENELATDCFTSERINVLSILTSQMAISLQNSRSFKEQLKIQQVAEFQRGRAQEAEIYREKQEEFIDRICHEIRNPIQGIMGNCDMMNVHIREMRQLIGHGQPEMLEKIQGLDSFVDAVAICAKYQKVITDDVLTLSKLEFGKIVLVDSALSPAVLLDGVIRMFEAEMEKKGIKMTRDVTGVEGLVANGDGMRISQVLINLLSNAIKFTSAGGIKIIMDQTSHGVKVELKCTVEDTGCGMHESECKHLFNRFEQVAQRTQSEYGGSGLGLFICKNLVNLMGGTIRVESVKDVGSRFIFTASLGYPSEEQLAEYRTQLEASVATPRVEKKQRDQQLKVLVVEDNKINHKVLTSMLVKAGCTCMGAYNGVEGLAMYKEHEFDLNFYGCHNASNEWL